MTEPVDRTKRTLVDGSPVPDDHSHTELMENGQQKHYVVLSEDERAKGWPWQRPYRDTYVHQTCGTKTTMGRSIAETYARDPSFYNATFCCKCLAHFPLKEFLWDGTSEQVGS